MVALTRSAARLAALIVLCVLSFAAWNLVGIWATLGGSLAVLGLALAGSRLRRRVSS